MSDFTNISNPSNLNKQNNNLNLDSDSEEYVDLEEMIKEREPDKKNIYQIQISEESMKIRLVGRESFVPDVIIKENFGPNDSLSLYSCLYDENDFKINIDENKNYFFPLIKLIEKKEDIIVIYSFTVKFTELIYDLDIKDYELYIVSNKYEDDFINVKSIEKNINPNNIIEKIIEYYNHILDTQEYIENNNRINPDNSNNTNNTNNINNSV